VVGERKEFEFEKVEEIPRARISDNEILGGAFKWSRRKEMHVTGNPSNLEQGSWGV